MPQYLDDNGNPIAAPAKQYLDDNGNPIPSPQKTYLDDNGDPISTSAAPAPRMAAGPAPKAVTDWQTIEPNDWQTVSAPPQSVALAPRGNPEARTAGNYASEIASGVGRGVVNDVTGLYQTLRHPRDTVNGLVNQLNTAQQASDKEYGDLASAYPNKYSLTRNLASMLTFAENAPVIGGMVQRAERGGTKPGSPEAVGAAAEGIATYAAPEALVKGIQLAPRAVESVVGTSPRIVGSLVKDTKAANAADAAKIADANYAAALRHLEDTQNALHETAGRELTHVEALKAATDEAKAKRKVQLTQHIAETAKAEAQRQAAQQKFESDRAAQRKIAPQAQKLADARSGLRASVETAREKALKVGNENYNTVNEKLNPVPADMEAVHGLYHEAAESMGEAQAEPPLIKRLGTALDRGGEMTYKDLQPIYSELGKELSKGTLPGMTYHAYDLMHEKIGGEMQRIADSQGQGAQLTNARGYWRRMKQTFGKPISFTDAASKAMGSLKDETQENQIRLLGSFDPDIPKQFNHVANVEKGADSLPNPVPERELTQKLVNSRPSLPGVPASIDARLPQPPERVAPPNRPPEILPAPRKIGEEDVQAAKTAKLQKRADRIRHIGYAASSWAPFYAVREMVHGGIPNFATMGIEMAGTAALGHEIANILERPRVKDFLTKATERDVAAIPEDLRGDFPQIINQAQKQGIKVSPAIVRGLQVGALAPRWNATDAWASGQQ